MTDNDTRTVTLRALADALDTVETMRGADPAWKRARRLARTYARQQNTTTQTAIKEAQQLRRAR